MTYSYSRSPDIQDVINAIIDQRLADVRTQIPGEIVKYNPSKQLADVKPLIRDFFITLEAEEIIEEIPVIPNVPVVFPRGSDGSFISLPLGKGSKVVLVFSDRPIGNYVDGDGSGVVDPEQRVMHSIDDAICYAGFYPTSQPIEGVDTKHIIIGKSGEAQDFVALQTKVEAELAKIRTAFNSHVHPTGVGPSGISNPQVSEIENVGSKTVKISG